MSTSGFDPKTFHDGLVAHGLIIPVGVQGVFGRGRVFEDVLERFNALVTAVAKDDGAESVTFPPVIDRKILERVDYLDSFPHLAGSVYSFFGNDERRARCPTRSSGRAVGRPAPRNRRRAESRRLLSRLPDPHRHASREGPPGLDDQLGLPPRAVARADAHAVVPRARVRARRPPDDVVAWRDKWLQRGLTLLAALGLPGDRTSRPIRSSAAPARCSRTARKSRS